MVKVLYISNYSDSTGWGNAAAMSIRALDSAGIKVVPRAITFNGYAGRLNTHPRILELEENDLSNIDVCIQHALPTNYFYHSNFKNIARYETETFDLSYSKWPNYINLLDEAWVPNKQAYDASIFSGVNRKVNIAHHCIDMDRFGKIEKTWNSDALKNSFNFCFVGELVSRKNLSALLKAFHIEFHPSENVNLVCKTNSPGLDSEKSLQKFEELNNFVTSGLKIRSRYKEPLSISGMLPENTLLSIMKHCHCFVCPSYGEAWCIPALEAMAVGMKVIYVDGTGLEEFAVGERVKSRRAPCFGTADALPEIYTSFDEWCEVDIFSLREKMRFMYNKFFDDSTDWGSASIEKAKTFDYRIVGKEIGALL